MQPKATTTHILARHNEWKSIAINMNKFKSSFLVAVFIEGLSSVNECNYEGGGLFPRVVSSLDDPASHSINMTVCGKCY